MSEQGCKVRLGTNGTNVQTQWLMFYWGVRKPDLGVYQDHTTKVTLGDGGQALRGRRSVTMAWNQLTDVEFQRLYTAWNNGNGSIWATIDRGWGETASLGDWIDISGKPHRPTATPRQGTDGLVWDNVTFFIAAVSIENDPASGL